MWHLSLLVERSNTAGPLDIKSTTVKIIDNKSREDFYTGFFDGPTNSADSSPILYKTSLERF